MRIMKTSYVKLKAFLVLFKLTGVLCDSIWNKDTPEAYDDPQGTLFSAMVSCEVFSESDIVLGIVKQF